MDTLQLWTQVVGKVRLALAPMVNHWWQVPLYVSAARAHDVGDVSDGRGLEMEFDFIDHQLALRTTDGRAPRRPRARSVANFYRATMAALDELGVAVRIFAPAGRDPRSDSVRRRRSTRRLRPRAAHRFWLGLLQANRVMGRIPGPLHRQGESGALLLGRGGPGDLTLLGPAGPDPPWQRAQLPRLGAGARLQPRGQ